MPTIIEISSSLVPALRVSEALPNTVDHGTSTLHLLFDAANHSVGDRVGKVSVGDASESQDPRFFITPSHAEAAHYLAISYAELPARESVLA